MKAHRIQNRASMLATLLKLRTPICLALRGARWARAGQKSFGATNASHIGLPAIFLALTLSAP
ncbi:MAG TPA: hypothetical protein VKY92_14625, partial [Verrucomicrobiae bacterium]|nr:hypothetical protein [Verrucomicrobiae bacterium]